jgi:hypothetical protein
MKTTYTWNPATKTFEAIGGSAQKRKQTHSVIQDSMNSTWHPITGEMIDSKSKFRKITKSHGCIEVGNEEQKQRPPETKDSDYTEAIIKAYENPNYQGKSVDRNTNFSDTMIRDAIEKARSELNK